MLDFLFLRLGLVEFLLIRVFQAGLIRVLGKFFSVLTGFFLVLCSSNSDELRWVAKFCLWLFSRFRLAPESHKQDWVFFIGNLKFGTN